MKNLELELKALVAQEREILHEILIKIREIDETKLYLNRGYPSLFEYLTREIGYSAGAAHRRIDAARLSREIPEVIGQIRDGCLSLAQIGEAQRGFRRTEISVEEKKELLQRLSSGPAGDAQKIVAEGLSLPIVKREVVRAQSDGSLRIAFNLSEAAAADLEKVKDLLSHQIPSGDTGAVFEKLLAFYLEKQKVTSTVKVRPRQKTVPRATRRHIFARDQVCQFPTPSGEICGSRFQLQVDHIQMRFHGGGHEPENLRLLCAAHNRHAAELTLTGEPVT